MASMSSPTDPPFFCHHSQIDRLWALWQDCYGFSSVPNTQITPTIYNDQGNPAFALDTPMMGFNNTPRDMHSILDWGYVYSDNGWAQSQSFSGYCNFSWYLREAEQILTRVDSDYSRSKAQGPYHVPEDVQRLVNNKHQKSHKTKSHKGKSSSQFKSHLYKTYEESDRITAKKKLLFTSEDEIANQGAASFAFQDDISVAPMSQQALQAINTIFENSLAQTGDYDVALAQAVAAECQLNPNQSPIPPLWVEMNNLHDEALAGSLNNPCIDDSQDTAALVIKKVKKHRPATSRKPVASKHTPSQRRHKKQSHSKKH